MEPSFVFHFASNFQRQAERIKREKAQVKRGDDAEPQVQPESLVPVARFEGSRLASGPSPSPYQQPGSSTSRKQDQLGKAASSMSVLDIQCKQSGTSDDKHTHIRAQKVARSTSGATIGAAIVEAENCLEIDVCFPALGEALSCNSYSSYSLRVDLSDNLKTFINTCHSLVLDSVSLY